MNAASNIERAPRRISRRRALQMAGAAAAATAIDFGLGPGRMTDAGQAALRKAEGMSPTHADLFESLFERINAGVSEDERQEALSLARDLQTIIHINDRFMHRYYDDVDEGGTPRLRRLYEAKYDPYQVEDPGSMIFFVTNDRLAEQIIVEPLKNLNTPSIPQTLRDIRNRVLSADENPGEGAFDSSINVGLIDYLKIDKKRGGRMEIQAREPNPEQSEDEKRTAENAADLARQVLVDIPHTDLKVNISAGADQFKELIDIPDVEVKSNDDEYAYTLALLHEVAGHGLDIKSNDVQLVQYLSPEAIHDLMLLREEALASSEWGRHYPDMRRVFDTKEGRPEISPPGEISLVNLRRTLDVYPDGIFTTGFYNGTPLAPREWIQREADQQITREYRDIFERENQKFDSLSDFMSFYKPYLDVLGEKSPWLGDVIDQVESMSPSVDKPFWVPGKVPSTGADAVSWYNFIVTVGQRVAVIEMFRKRSPTLSLLSPQELADFRLQMLAPLTLADNELFAEMTAYSLATKITRYQTPNPYLEYFRRIKEELKEKIVSITPSEGLTSLIEGQLQKTA